MPIYEFCCKACGAYFEEIVAASAGENPKCPRCGGNEGVERIVSGFSIRPHGNPLTSSQMRKKVYGNK